MDFLAIVSWGLWPGSGPVPTKQERAISAASYGLLAHVYELLGVGTQRKSWMLYLRAAGRR